MKTNENNISIEDNKLTVIESDKVNEKIREIGMMIAKQHSKTENDNRLIVYYTFLSLGHSSYQSAVNAGYSPSYAKTNVLGNKQCPEHISKAIEKYLGRKKVDYVNKNILMLEQIAVNDQMFLDETTNDIETYMKGQTIVNRITNVAGVQDLNVSKGMTVNIGQIQAYLAAELKVNDD